MRPLILANENFPGPSVQHLRERGHYVIAVAESQGNPDDPFVLAVAVADKRWIVTFDRDYGELTFARHLRPPPADFLFRSRSYPTKDPGRILAGMLDSGAEFDGQFVRVEDSQNRIWPLRMRKPASHLGARRRCSERGWCEPPSRASIGFQFGSLHRGHGRPPSVELAPNNFEEFLAREKRQPERHEFVRGEVRPMVGASKDHDRAVRRMSQ